MPCRQLATLRERLVAAAADRKAATSERKAASPGATGAGAAGPGCSSLWVVERKRWGPGAHSGGPQGSGGGGGGGGVLRATRGAEAPTTIASDLARSH